MAGRTSRITFSDWALLAISLMFCAGGLFLLAHEPGVGIGTLLFFGPGLFFAIHRLVQKRRRDRFNATLVSALGGVELRGSGSLFLVIGLMAVCWGISPYFYPDAPVSIMILCGVFLVAGIASILAAATGVLSKRYLRFDPDGLTVNEWRYSIRVGWDNITGVAEFEYASNDCVGFNVMDPDQVRVTPETKRASWLKSIGNGAALMGRHLVIMPAHYAVDAAPLAMALSRYAASVRARAELVPQPALEMGSDPKS